MSETNVDLPTFFNDIAAFFGDSEMNSNIDYTGFENLWFEHDDKYGKNYKNSIEVTNMQDLQEIVDDFIKHDKQDSLKVFLSESKKIFDSDTNEHLIDIKSVIARLEKYDITNPSTIDIGREDLDMFYNYILIYKNAVDSIMSNVNNIKSTFFKSFINFKSLLEDLKIISAAFSDIRWNKERSCLFIQTPEIILKEPDFVDSPKFINLGRMVICLNYHQNINEKFTYRIFPLDPNVPLTYHRVINYTDGMYFHPHVSKSGALCAGEARLAIENTIQDCRLVDFIDLIMGILSNYNPLSPYYKLENWSIIQCSICNSNIQWKDKNVCGCCGKIICNRCLYSCMECRHDPAVCNHYISTSKKSRKKYIKCSICNQNYCIKHYRSIRKHKCYEDILKLRKEKVLEFQQQIATFDLLWHEKFDKIIKAEEQKLFEIQEYHRERKKEEEYFKNQEERKKEVIRIEQEKNKTVIVTDVIVRTNVNVLQNEELDEIVQASTTGPAGWAI